MRRAVKFLCIFSLSNPFISALHFMRSSVLILDFHLSWKLFLCIKEYNWGRICAWEKPFTVVVLFYRMSCWCAVDFVLCLCKKMLSLINDTKISNMSKLVWSLCVSALTAWKQFPFSHWSWSPWLHGNLKSRFSE